MWFKFLFIGLISLLLQCVKVIMVLCILFLIIYVSSKYIDFTPLLNYLKLKLK